MRKQKTKDYKKAKTL